MTRENEGLGILYFYLLGLATHCQSPYLFLLSLLRLLLPPSSPSLSSPSTFPSLSDPKGSSTPWALTHLLASVAPATLTHLEVLNLWTGCSHHGDPVSSLGCQASLSLLGFRLFPDVSRVCHAQGRVSCFPQHVSCCTSAAFWGWQQESPGPIASSIHDEGKSKHMDETKRRGD